MSGLGRKNDRVAGHQGGDQFLKTHQQRSVVWRDGRDHADRLVSANAQGNPPAHQFVDRYRAGFLVVHRQVEVDGVARQRQSTADLCPRRRTPSAVRPRPPAWEPGCRGWLRCSRRTHATSWRGPRRAASAHTPSSKLRRASAIARSTSARGVAVTSPTCVSSAGFSTRTTSSPVTHWPATYVRCSERIVTSTPHLTVRWTSTPPVDSSRPGPGYADQST